MNAPATTAIGWQRFTTDHSISEGDYQVGQMSSGWVRFREGGGGRIFAGMGRERERGQKWHKETGGSLN